MANPNQQLIDQLKAVIASLDDAEAQLDAAVVQYQQLKTDTQAAADAACAQAQQQAADAATAADDAIAAANAQKATYEAQEAALRAAVTALGG